jgi:hypothetical protein
MNADKFIEYKKTQAFGIRTLVFIAPQGNGKMLWDCTWGEGVLVAGFCII